ncbi:MAG: UDP-glucose/GDP-mannose dehydrogenase family protein [Candidatus Diapherotrites archaeon]
MKVCVVGTGYVGLVAGCCLADLGNEVICVDIDEKKINALKKGEIPIFEPGLAELVERNSREGRLSFTTNLHEAVKDSETIFIAVGTPMSDNGEADMKYVYKVAEDIGKVMNSYKVIINKSTVPVGSGGKVKEIISRHYSGEFDVVSNPEFLREGSAIRDFMEPDRVVIGASSEKAAEIVKGLYAPLKSEILVTDVESAEIIKYASNAFLATKISFINEIANLCEKVGADVETVSRGMGLDKRIGNSFLNAGCGYGGSCFPKDVKAIMHTAKENGLEMNVIRAADEVNKRQKIVPVEKAEEMLGDLKGKNIALLGLAFKPNTDDMRAASSIEIANLLVEKGANVMAFDPVAENEAKKILPNISYGDNFYDALKGADLMIIATEWNEFKEMDLEKAKELMNSPAIVDGRNILNREKALEMGFKYTGIGR